MPISDWEVLFFTSRTVWKKSSKDELTEKALLEIEWQEFIAAAAITAGAPNSDVAASALAAKEASSAAFLALWNALEATSTKEKADREQDERGAVNAAKCKKRTTKRECKRAEKEANLTTKRERKEADHTTWTAEINEAIMRMIVDSSIYTNITSGLGNGLKRSGINHRWNYSSKKSTGIIKPPVQAGWHSSITWTVEVDKAITCMIADNSTYTNIALELGNGLNRSEIFNRWKKCLTA